MDGPIGAPERLVPRRSLTALSPEYGTKSIDLCSGEDLICSGGGDVEAHSRYVETGMTDLAAHFAVDRL